MIVSRDRILTTHVGSLPRNDKLSDLLMMREEGKSFDPKMMADEMDKAVRHVVGKQKTAYEIYRCDWSSDVCSSDLKRG